MKTRLTDLETSESEFTRKTSNNLTLKWLLKATASIANGPRKFSEFFKDIEPPPGLVLPASVSVSTKI